MSAGSVAALGVLWAPHVSAQTLDKVSVTGVCPTEEQVVTALAARAIPESARDYRLTVRSGPGYTEFLLGDRNGQVALDRFVASDDCSAMADVVALVTEAFFLELVAKGHPPDDTSALLSSKPAPPPAAPPADDTKISPVPSQSAEVNAHGALAAKPRAAAAAAKPVAPTATHTEGEARRRHAVLALGVGADAYADPSAVAPFGQLGAGLYFAAPRLSLELHAVAEVAEALRSAPNRVLRSETRIALRALRDFGDKVIMAPWLGFGAAVSRSRALDLDGPVRHLAAPLVEGGVVLRAAHTARLGVSAELGCHLLLVRERYVVAPDGDIGSGPAFGCQLGPNISWSSPEF